MSPVTREYYLFSLRQEVGLFLLFLRDFEQVSKNQRNWTVRVSNPEGLSINFTGVGGDSQQLKGKWVFLNQKNGEKENLFKEGNVFFGIAVPEANDIKNFGGPNYANGITKLLVCARSEGTFGGGGTSVKYKENENGYCKDVSDRWYFGYVNGDYYDANFIVRKTGAFKKDWRWWERSIDEIEWKGTEGLNETLLEILKLATKSGNKFWGQNGKVNNGEVSKVNNRTGNYGNEKYKNEWCGHNICFQWIGMDDEGDPKKLISNNCGKEDSFEGCSIGIIDVSRYTG